MPTQYFQEEQPCILVLLIGRSGGCFLLPELSYEPKMAEIKNYCVLHSINKINMVCKMQVQSNQKNEYREITCNFHHSI